MARNSIVCRLLVGKRRIYVYESILEYRWMNLQAVLLVKEEEGTRIWLCGITTKLLITYLIKHMYPSRLLVYVNF